MKVIERRTTTYDAIQFIDNNVEEIKKFVSGKLDTCVEITRENDTIRFENDVDRWVLKDTDWLLSDINIKHSLYSTPDKHFNNYFITIDSKPSVDESWLIEVPDPKNSCTWKSLNNGTYETSCNHMFQLNDGSPDDNEFKYCPFCGEMINTGIAG